MNWITVWEWIQAAQLPVLVGLIVLDVVLGVARSIKTGTFNWALLGEFYRSMVAPYLITYLVLYAAVDLVPELEGFIGDGLVAMAFGAITYNLVQSIITNLKVLGLDKNRNG